MKKKILTILLVCLLGFSTFFLTACGGGGGGSMDDAINNGDSGLPKPDPDPDQGEEDTGTANFADYFDGYRVLTNGDENYQIFDDVTGEKVTFNQLLDRQFSALAEDILYRLLVVYGNENKTNLPNKLLTNTINDKEFELDGNKADIVINSLLTKSNEHISGDYPTANIDCIYCYQEVVNNINFNVSEDSALNKRSIIMLIGAISGQYMSYDSRNSELLPKMISEKQWKSYDASKYFIDGKNDEMKYLNDCIKEVKMSIAKIIVDDTDYLTIDYNENDYNNTLKRINNLGYLGKNSSITALEDFNRTIDYKIIEVINNKIIGLDRINENMAIYNKFSESEKGDLWNWFEQEEIIKHFFKGYNIVVPAVVEMALNNTFSKTVKNGEQSVTEFTDKTIYPYSLRVGSQEGNFNTIPNDNTGDFVLTEKMTTTGPIKFNSLILKPKNNVLLKELLMNINVARDTMPNLAPGSIAKDINRYKRDIIVEFEVNISYYTQSSTDPYCSKIMLGSHEESTVLTVDSAGYKAGEVSDYLEYSFSFNFKDNIGTLPPKFGEFNGSKTEIDKMTAWANDFELNEDGTALSLKTGNNYVQVNFVNVKAKQLVTGSGGREYVPYAGTDIVFDLNILPLN